MGCFAAKATKSALVRNFIALLLRELRDLAGRELDWLLFPDQLKLWARRRRPRRLRTFFFFFFFLCRPLSFLLCSRVISRSLKTAAQAPGRATAL